MLSSIMINVIMLNVATELKGALYWLALVLLASIRLDLTRLDFRLLSPFVDYEDKSAHVA